MELLNDNYRWKSVINKFERQVLILGDTYTAMAFYSFYMDDEELLERRILRHLRFDDCPDEDVLEKIEKLTQDVEKETLIELIEE